MVSQAGFFPDLHPEWRVPETEENVAGDVGGTSSLLGPWHRREGGTPSAAAILRASTGTSHRGNPSPLTKYRIVLFNRIRVSVKLGIRSPGKSSVPGIAQFSERSALPMTSGRSWDHICLVAKCKCTGAIECRSCRNTMNDAERKRSIAWPTPVPAVPRSGVGIANCSMSRIHPFPDQFGPFICPFRAVATRLTFGPTWHPASRSEQCMHARLHGKTAGRR